MGLLSSKEDAFALGLFTVGNFLYGRLGLALLLLGLFVASGLVLLYVMNKLWGGGAPAAGAGAPPPERSLAAGSAKS